ncbi:MAG: transporter, partial [Hylemonella sp.]
LLGRVTAREADRATDLARRSSGVQKVVRLFEIITEEDLLEMQSQPGSSGGSSSSSASGRAL